MTTTINITQEILDNLTSGEHTLNVKATSESGFSATARGTFNKKGNFAISVPILGEYGSAFDFDIALEYVNGTANVFGYIDGVQFYQLNYGASGTYKVKVTDSTISSIGGGVHTITFTGNDTEGMSAEASQTFTKTYTYPLVSFATNLGDKTSAFSVSYAIKNVASEKPSLVAYMDTTDNVIIELADASTANSFTIDNFEELEDGSHTIILNVTNQAGTTTKNASFNKVSQSAVFTGLKLGYSDDTWDGTALENRIYSEKNVTYEGQTYKSFEDNTPYDTEGEPVTGALLAAFSRGVQNASASNTVMNANGTLTETSANGTSTITPTADGYTEVYVDKEGNTLTKNTFFNADGSISESTTYVKAAE